MRANIKWRIQPGLRVPRVLVRQLSRYLRRACSRLGLCKDRRNFLELHIVNDLEMARLNAQSLGKRGPTDVLSFPTSIWNLRHTMDTFSGPIPMGDIVLNWQAVVRQARGQDAQAQLQEAVILCIHGLVHLLGHDHRKPRESRDMHRCELRALAAVRVPDIPRPYGLQPIRPRLSSSI